MRKKLTALVMATVLSLAPALTVQASSVDDVQTGEEVSVVTESVQEDNGDTDRINSYIDDGTRVEYYTPVSDMPMLYSSPLPASYDSRDYGYVTPVKNQGTFGTCWAFAALAAGESSMLAQGYVDSADEIDLSEYHFSYFFFNYVNDPLGNLTNDISAVTADNNYLFVGGNSYYSMFALASWRGAADETVAPYEDVTTTSTLSSDLAFNDVAHMQNTYIVSMQNAADVKKLIMEYGAVASALYFDNFKYYNINTKSYYQDDVAYSDHAVTIVGWDDDYSVDKFLESEYAPKPSNPGAWLVKNSWGEGIYDYFWVSYEDLCMSGQDAFAFVFEDADNYDKNYQYDGTYGTSYWGIYNNNGFANVYTCEGEYIEKIDAVSFALAEANVDYSIQIYKNPDVDNPESGEALLSTPQTGSTTYIGYYTIELNEDIYINPGDTFAVAVKFSETVVDDGYVYVYLDGDVGCADCSCPFYFDSYTEEYQSYYLTWYMDPSDMHEETWSDGSNYNNCARIKAFTTITDERPDAGTGDTPTGGEDNPTDTPSSGEEDDPSDIPSSGEEDDPSDTPSGGEDDSTDTPSGGEEDDPSDTPSGGEEDDPADTPSDEKEESVIKSSWSYVNGKWYYYDASGILSVGWKYIDGAWYYFNSNGVMQTGWQQIAGNWYYMDSSGAMLTGWHEIGGTWYYFYSDGSMASSTWIGSYYVDASGAWITNTSTNTYTEGWKISGGLWWYQNADGSYPTSAWKSIGGAWYYFDAAGWMKTGWVHDGTGWYYMNPSGTMYTGWLNDGGIWYYLTGSGLMHTGWLNDNGIWYYMIGSGAMATSTVIDGYTIDANGVWVQ